MTAGRRPSANASSAETLAARLDARDPAVGLPALAALRRLLDDLEATQVDRARSAGWSWADIADSLGVSRQSVHKKHARTLPRR